MYIVFIYMYTSTQTQTYVYIYIYIYICTHVPTYITDAYLPLKPLQSGTVPHIYTCQYIHISIHILYRRICIYRNTYMYMYIYMHTHTCITSLYIYVYMHTHTYIHNPRRTTIYTPPARHYSMYIYI